jgi:hypothetical protein
MQGQEGQILEGQDVGGEVSGQGEHAIDSKAHEHASERIAIAAGNTVSGVDLLDRDALWSDLLHGFVLVSGWGVLGADFSVEGKPLWPFW